VSLVTGRYLHDHKVGQVEREPWLGWGKRGLGGFPTIGEALERHGYRTGAFSANRTYFSSDLGFGRSFIHFDDYFNSAPDCFVRTLYGREFARIYLKRSDKSLVKRALRALGMNSLLDQDAEGSGSYGGAFGIRKHASEVNDELLRWVDSDAEHPFFAFLNYFDVHDPYGGPHSYPRPGWPQVSDIDRYDSGVKYADDQLGVLLDSLRQHGLTDNTIIIVTSDHGESLGQHHLETHGRALYWELVHVPLVIWYPKEVPHGVKIDTPVTNAAIPGTILDLLNAGNASFPGPGLDQIWKKQGDDLQLQLPISELVENKYPGKRDAGADRLIPTATTGWMRTLVTPQWQLVVHQTMGPQIYDWVHDPGELHNLINTPEGQAAAKSLEPTLRDTSAP
jgi:arylsulfatase A-like enzyme